MIPLRDVIPSRTTPYITVTLIVLNAAAWLSSCRVRRPVAVFLQVYGVVPADFSTPTLISSMFLHGSWCTSSATCGTSGSSATTSRTGWATAGSSVLSALRLVAALGQIAIDPLSTLPTIGASGAIAGVMGAYFVLYPQSRVLTLIP